MPAENVRLLRSIRRWLLAIVFVLGAGLVTLAHLGYVVTGYEGGAVFLAAATAGGTVAVAAAAYWLGSVTRPADADGGAGDDTAEGDPREPNA